MAFRSNGTSGKTVKPVLWPLQRLFARQHYLNESGNAGHNSTLIDDADLYMDTMLDVLIGGEEDDGEVKTDGDTSVAPYAWQMVRKWHYRW